jgi:hypothetical protein
MGDPPEPRPLTVLVEHYWPGVTAETFRAAAERVQRRATELARAGELIRYLHGTLVPGDEAAFCVFEAASVELVRQAYAQAQVPYERLLIALEIDVEARSALQEDRVSGA